MRQLRAWCARLLGLFDRDRRDRDFAAEFDSHVQLHVDDNLRDGMAPAAARRDALLALGSLETTKERQRDQQGNPLLDMLAHDLRFAARMLRKNPGFTATAVLTLALGIGANTAMFSVVNAVLLRPLPYPDPERIVMFMTTTPSTSTPGASPAIFNTYRRETQAFQDISAFQFGVMNLTGSDRPAQVASASVSADFFPLFDASMAMGRSFNAEDDLPGGRQVVVLGYGFWQRQFGAARDVVGRALSLNGAPYTIVGVLGDQFSPEGVNPPTGAPDVWVPIQIDPNSVFQGYYFQVTGRLRPGISVAAANARLRATAEEFRRTFPGIIGPNLTFSVQPLQSVIVRDVRLLLLLLNGAVALVLLIACANVASLLLARASARTREIAIRCAIGASRGRLVGQLLTESLMLSMLGGALGLLLGTLGIRALLAFAPGRLPRIGEQGVTADWHVAAFTLVLSLATGIVFGLIPAWRGSRADLTLRVAEDSARSGTGMTSNRTRSVLVVAQIALAVVLLTGATLLIRSFVTLRAVSPGFDPHQVLTLRMSVNEPRFAKTAGVTALVRDGIQRVAGLPDVVSAAATWCCVPTEGNQLALPFTIVGRPLSGPTPYHYGGGWNLVSHGYFDAFRIPVVRGRAFTERDDATAPPVVIINQAAARRFWPQDDPIGERLILGKGYLDDVPRQIVGVVADVHGRSLTQDPIPSTYIPLAQAPETFNALIITVTPIVWIARTRGEPQAARAAIEYELNAASGGLAVAGVRSMDDIVSGSTAPRRFNMLLMTSFGCGALLLAAIGIYGLMAYTVELRTREFGIRLALGARPSNIRAAVVTRGMLTAAGGCAVGILSALGLARLITSFLFGVTAHDPVVFVTVPVLLGAVALVAVWVPAVRASRVNPTVALRAE